jgi:hypothetical protein
MKRYITLAVAALLVVAASSLTEAARQPKYGSASGVITVAPYPTVQRGTMYTVSGSGFRAGTWVPVNLEIACVGGGMLKELAWYGMVEAGGTFTFFRTTSNCNGTYTLSATVGRNTTAPTTFNVQ